MSSSRRQYPFHLIEPKWQKAWDEQQAFRAFNPGDAIPPDHPFAQRHKISGKVAASQLPPKFYILDMFPYPSGAGLHVGHPEGYTATDILARYKRAQGFNVLHPMGWDAFGLPAEQYAVKTGRHPRKTTEENIATFKRQIKSLGFSYDWSREIATTDPDYFKWTQWIFLKLYNSWFNLKTNKAEPIETLEYPAGLRVPFSTSDKTELENLELSRRTFRDSKRLAFVKEAPVWWCEELGTVLANEEVVDGKSEVGGFPVVRKLMRQWMLRITAYAKKLLSDLNTIDWTDSLKEMQRNWIGRSEGAEVDFNVADLNETIRVFTTRPDTLFGATYMVLAPENRIVNEMVRDMKASMKAWPEGIPAAWKTNPNTGKEYERPVNAMVEYRLDTHLETRSDLDRTDLSKDKTGVFTGFYAINPVTGEKIPVWIADYVLASYGTGAVMAVPAHDERDFAFAKKYELPIHPVVLPPREWLQQHLVDYIDIDEFRNLRDKKYFEVVDAAFCDDGIAINSDALQFSIDGLKTPEARREVIERLEFKRRGKSTINYKLRDWLFSRQRYWGEPFPIVWKIGPDGQSFHEALPEKDLPVLPPELTDYKPTATGEPPLARAKDWLNLPDGSTRETNTMPQWAGSCWYYLRYLDAKNDSTFVGKDAENYWMGGKSAGVDLYVGGTEHAVLHLLYARFWHKVLFDLGCVSTPEPFFKLVNQGLILGELEFYLFRDKNGEPIGVEGIKDIADVGQTLVGKDKITNEEIVANKIEEDKVEKRGAWFCLKDCPHNVRVETRCFKMSKSRGNVVNPDDVLREFGTDALRLYEMFMGPLEMVKPWSTKGVEGVYRFLGRVWRLFVDEKSETEFEQAETTTKTQSHQDLLELIKLDSAFQNVAATSAQLKTLHACIKKVTEDLDGLRFNTAISALMIFVNEAMAWETKSVSVLREFLILLQPFAPHLAEELWSKLPDSGNLAYSKWPKFDPTLLVESEIEIPVQVNGKLRDVIKVSANATQADLETAAKNSEKVKSFIEGKTIKKIIVVSKKMVNLIVG